MPPCPIFGAKWWYSRHVWVCFADIGVTNMNTNYSKLPLLRVSEEGNIWDETGNRIANLNNLELAEQVVHACNLYPKLVEALNAILQDHDILDGGECVVSEYLINQARAVLAETEAQG